jgi:hypothetical protein
MHHAGIRFRARWIILAVCIFPMLSCTTVREAIFPPTLTSTPTITPTATPTQTQTPTPTRIPIADLDLKDLALKPSDLPDGGFIEVDIPNAEDALKRSNAALADILLQDLVKAFEVLFTKSDGTLYAHVILVYTETPAAQAAFGDYQDESTSLEDADVPKIGDGSFGRTMAADTTVVYVVVWTYREVMMEIDYFGKEDIGIDEMIRLAGIAQSRLEQAY